MNNPTIDDSGMYWLIGVFVAVVSVMWGIGFVIYLMRMHYDESFRRR